MKKPTVWNILFRHLKELFFVFLLLLHGSVLVHAQKTKTISGKISDQSGKPLAGASVSVKGSSQGTASASDGRFSINASLNDVLSISSVGFETKELVVREGTDYNISLFPNTASNLNEVIVVGYGTQKRTLVTGAVSSVNTKTLNEVCRPKKSLHFF